MSPLVSHAVLDEIRLANDVVNVIGSYFQIQRSGANYKALCPFHKEKTQFPVYTKRGVRGGYYDFLVERCFLIHAV